MWTKIHSKIYQGINKKDIWRIWTDVNNGRYFYCRQSFYVET